MSGFELVCAGDGAPELSVLMPVWEQERFVVDAVRSVLAQQDVIAEVIVSDDASVDRTWDRVREAVASAPPHPHRLVLRRGSTRLRRDHLPLLVDHARCDIVMAAHGDDISAPERARRVVDVLTTSGAVLTGSHSVTIDDAGRPTPAAHEHRRDLATGDLLGPADLLAWSTDFTGSLLAWRRQPMAGFARLDAAHLSAGHDHLLPFRAALAGGVTVIQEPLVQRRVHDDSWSHAIWDRRRPGAIEFGRELTLLAADRAMARDLGRAEELGLVGPDEADGVRRALHAAAPRRVDRIMAAHDTLIGEGLVPLWVTGAEANLAYRGSLGSVLARRARRWGPVDTGITALRRWRPTRRMRTR